MPVEYQALGTLKAFGGIAIDGSEDGLLVFSTKEMFIGAMLKVIVFFPSGYELDSLEVVAEIVRREAYQREAGKGYEYGLKIVRIEEGDLQKLKQLLSGQLAQEEVSRKFFSEISSEA